MVSLAQNYPGIFKCQINSISFKIFTTKTVIKLFFNYGELKFNMKYTRLCCHFIVGCVFTNELYTMEVT